MLKKVGHWLLVAVAGIILALLFLVRLLKPVAGSLIERSVGAVLGVVIVVGALWAIVGVLVLVGRIGDRADRAQPPKSRPKE